MTPMQRLQNALSILDEDAFFNLPLEARKVVYAAVEVERAYRNYLLEEKEKVIPFPSLKVAK